MVERAAYSGFVQLEIRDPVAQQAADAAGAQQGRIDRARRAAEGQGVSAVRIGDDRGQGLIQSDAAARQGVGDHVDGAQVAQVVEGGAVQQLQHQVGEDRQKLDADFIMVTNEVGMGLVPDNRLGRLYRDLLGKANQMLASHATEVYLMIACLPVQVKGKI